MKTLPDNPSLDHLRRQAKDLLTGLRDLRPEASLADAQASLAEQYGFRTWADLKAETDRRQDSADVSSPELAARIAARFGLGPVTAPMRSLSRPDEIGRRWGLDTERGRWTARTVDDVYPVTDGEADTRFQEAAATAGVTLPRPVRDVDGAVIAMIDGHRWRIYERLRSGPPLAAPVSAAVTRSVGEILATLHDLRIPAARLCPWSSRRLGPVPSNPAHNDLAAIGSRPATGSPILCHNNLNPGNVRTGAGGRLIVTGWEHAAGLPPAWELSSALANWAVDPNGGVSAGGARALVDGYRSRAGSVPHLNLDTFSGTATALLNYVSGQVELAEKARGDEDVRFAERNVRHLLTHLPSRATFEHILEAVRA
ncbi:phosphotransferase enzyme family protein [Actinoplanes sp. HUAS TT8]|uniref:phosphotransferase enzyme family protein n=1 Tax=Actinoplanes sp. HUAS TT8 TaxID=3447453 RepID=UPI003F527E6E